MKTVPFEMLKRQFATAGTEGKIKLYTEAEGLTQEQYVELLRMFPITELDKLEKAVYS